jgi:hypothetical protein
LAALSLRGEKIAPHPFAVVWNTSPGNSGGLGSVGATIGSCVAA